MDRPAGTARKAATVSVNTSWLAKIRRSRMISSGCCYRTAAERTRKRQHKPGDDAKTNRQRGGNREIRSEGKLGVDEHRQHVDIGRKRKGGTEGAHRGRKGDGARRDECRRQRRKH